MINSPSYSFYRLGSYFPSSFGFFLFFSCSGLWDKATLVFCMFLSLGLVSLKAIVPLHYLFCCQNQMAEILGVFSAWQDWTHACRESHCIHRAFILPVRPEQGCRRQYPLPCNGSTAQLHCHQRYYSALPLLGFWPSWPFQRNDLTCHDEEAVPSLDKRLHF